MEEGSDLPYRAEYAKSGRSSCKSCRTNIAKEELRLAVMVQSPMFDGRVPNWFHEACFFRRAKVKSVADIAHFDSLRWDDQQKLKKNIGGTGDGGGSTPSSNSVQNDLKDFATEYAKSNRSKCRGCELKIEKDIVRISKLDYEGERALMHGPQAMWYHIDCFVRAREELEYYVAADKLPGFYALGVDDQKELKGKLKQIVNKRKKSDQVDGTPAKKIKTENKEDLELKTQNELLYKYRDQLQKNLTKNEMVELLEHNGQENAKGESRILDRLSDCMAFGALKPCPECKEGQLVYSQDGYHCTGNMTEWTKCQHVTKDPKRKPFTIPHEMLDEHNFLKKYLYTKRTRLFATRHTTPSHASSVASSASQKTRPLENMKFAIVGKLKTAKPQLVKKIEDLGGKVIVKIDKYLACVISNEDEVKKMSKKICEARDANVHVVSEAFLDAVQNGGAALMIAQNSIATWGSDPESRINISHISRMKSLSGVNYMKSMPLKAKMKLKGGAVVDPESGMDSSAHIFEERGSPYDAALSMVDIQRGQNSYYKLQLLEADKGNSYWVFRSWGRVGTTIGGNKLDRCGTKLEAINLFKTLYEEKTGNLWENRIFFVKQPGRFYPLDIDYGQEDEVVKKSKLEPGQESKLPKPVQELICLLFDVENMKKALLEFEIDLNKMPLGKLSKRQIEKAYSVLTEAQELIKKGDPNKTMLLDASNRFYTLIPHDFGMRKPPLLDNEELVKTKLEMLESLLEIEVAYNLVNEKDQNKSRSPIDHHYHQLKTEIQPVTKEAEEFKTIQKYIQNTHAATHSHYTLDIEQVFKVKRHGEEKRYKPFKSLHNKKLLWHGSRVTNFAGILSQGLRIAPPEAPTTGYMFGKGLYFADMVSKSANYCCTSKNNPTGLIMLCEVALGNMYERTNAEYVQTLPPNMHSTKGVGKTEPNPSEKVVSPDGVEIPLGKCQDSNVKNSSLLYNEYIVYDVAQVHIKYLLKIDFKYKY